MSGSDEHDTTEEFPGLSELLRDEPVEVDIARRDVAISAALSLGADLYTDGTDVEAPPGTAQPATTDGELARRRARSAEPGPVPAPAHRSTRRRPRTLVAAAVLVIAGLGISGLLVNLSSGTDLVEVANDLGSSSNSGDEGGGATQMDDSAAPSAPSESDQDAPGTAAPEVGSTEGSPADGSADAAPSTTIAAVSGVAGMGDYDSAAALLAAARSMARSFDETTDAMPALGSQCQGVLSAGGLVEVGRATLRSVPVLVAVKGDSVVVLDVATCAVLAQS